MGANESEIVELSVHQEILKVCAENKKEIAALNRKLDTLCEKEEDASSSIDRRLSRKLDRVLESYKSSFSMHGLMFIINGKSLQRVSWGIFTLGVLVLAV